MVFAHVSLSCWRMSVLCRRGGISSEEKLPRVFLACVKCKKMAAVHRRRAEIRTELDRHGSELRATATPQPRREEVAARCAELHEELRVRAESRAESPPSTAVLKACGQQHALSCDACLSSRQVLMLDVEELMKPAPESTKEEKDAQKEAMIARSAPGSPLVRSGSPFARSGSPFARGGSPRPGRSESPFRKALAKARGGKSPVPGQRAASSENATPANA